MPKTICMFDVDGTLTPARLKASPTMIAHLKALRDVCATAFVGGSDLVKQEEQLGIDGANSESHPVTGVSPRRGSKAGWKAQGKECAEGRAFSLRPAWLCSCRIPEPSRLLRRPLLRHPVPSAPPSARSAQPSA
jgi:hypothetical protein